MYLLSQLASYMFLTFLLGVGVGYTLWRTWGEREVVAKYKAAELRLAEYLQRAEQKNDMGSETVSPFAPKRAGTSVGGEKW